MPTIIPSLIASQIRQARLALGMGQKPLGQSIGLRQGQVSALERSLPVRIAPKSLHLLKKVLGVEISGFAEDGATDVYILPAEQSLHVVSSFVEARLIERLRANPSLLHGIDTRVFEELVAELWYGFGYKVELTKRTRDGGKDIIAISDKEAATKYLIECKRPREGTPIGVAPVRELYGVKVSDGATKAILATTTRFTKDAQLFLDKHRWELEGRDYDGILEWLNRYLGSKR